MYASCKWVSTHVHDALLSVCRGVSMFAMLTGTLPFTVEPFNIKQLHQKMVNGEISSIPGDVSKGNFTYLNGFFPKTKMLPWFNFNCPMRQLPSYSWSVSRVFALSLDKG